MRQHALLAGAAEGAVALVPAATSNLRAMCSICSSSCGGGWFDSVGGGPIQIGAPPPQGPGAGASLAPAEPRRVQRQPTRHGIHQRHLES
jgi:hypothetical protein